jgi:hypothetical protein
VTRAALLSAIALLCASCNGCAPVPAPAPTPPAPSGAPAPVMADAGDVCGSACEAAGALCDRPAMSASECARRCAMGLANLSGPTANARCLAAELMCSSKEGCVP